MKSGGMPLTAAIHASRLGRQGGSVWPETGTKATGAAEPSEDDLGRVITHLSALEKMLQQAVEVRALHGRAYIRLNPDDTLEVLSPDAVEGPRDSRSAQD